MQAQQKPARPETIRVVALRSFQVAGGKVVTKGAELELPRAFALELIHANKAKAIVVETAGAAPSAHGEKAGELKKGAGNAR